ncbi:MAG: potassium channel family protein [Thaumarchaeota archaeon]|nr:potassium channel family protein [Nitrososphaerota archaeon]
MTNATLASGIFRRSLRRAVYSLLIVTIVLVVGTFGIHYFEGWNYIDSFYFTSMLVTAEGPANTPATDPGKIFAAFMAFVGVGSVITASVYLFGPAVGALWRKGVYEVEKEIRVVERSVEQKPKEDT